VRWLRTNLGHGPLGWAFLRSGVPTRVTCIGEEGYIPSAREDDDNGPATVAALTAKALSTKISDTHYIYADRESERLGSYQTEEWFPESDCARALDQPDLLPFLRTLRGVTHTPLPRSEGGMLVEAGYDEASGLLHHPLGSIPSVPSNPTKAQIAASVARVRGMVDQFSWAGDHDEANFIGALLTPLMRLVTPPPYKMVAIAAHQRGSGKSLLAEVVRTVHGGSLRSWPGTEEELGKQITAVLTQTTAPVAQIDNIRGLVKSAKLEALLTTREWTDRLLGSTNDTTAINDRLWVATGNNLTLGGDLDRRVVWVSIDPGIERPEDRTGFKIADLAGYVRLNRGIILGDLLTMLSAWDAAGRPTGDTTSDSFGPWVAAVRGVLALCEVPGTFDHADSRSDAVDPDVDDAITFLGAVEDYFGDRAWTAKDVTAAMKDPTGFAPVTDDEIKRAALYEAFPTNGRGKYWRPGSPCSELSRPLGYWMRNREGMWFGGRRAVGAGRTAAGALYRLETAK